MYGKFLHKNLLWLYKRRVFVYNVTADRKNCKYAIIITDFN